MTKQSRGRWHGAVATASAWCEELDMRSGRERTFGQVRFRPYSVVQLLVLLVSVSVYIRAAHIV